MKKYFCGIFLSKIFDSINVFLFFMQLCSFFSFAQFQFINFSCFFAKTKRNIFIIILLGRVAISTHTHFYSLIFLPFIAFSSTFVVFQYFAQDFCCSINTWSIYMWSNERKARIRHNSTWNSFNCPKGF